MSDHDNIAVDVVSALSGSVGEVGMHATAGEIVEAGRSRRRRRRLAGTAAALAVAGLGAGVAYGGTAPATSPAATGVHIQEAAFMVDTRADGTVVVTWDKQRYFDDPRGLEAALRKAGMPVIVRMGRFCVGPNDDPTLNRSGDGPGIDKVMKGERTADGRVNLVFTPSAMPAGKELFIGYLNASQLAVTQGRPASVERLVTVGAPLTCTTTPPPGH